MADFQTDIHTIHYLVNQSKSKEEALNRFSNMHGFSITRQQAQQALDKAMGERFLAKTDSIASVLATKYGVS